MTLFLFFVGVFQCAIIWMLGQAGVGLRERAKKEKELARSEPRSGWPVCAMIIPVSGARPYMENALRSLLNQDYPDYSVRIVTATADDAAMGLINRLMDDYPALIHITAGETAGMGQKNHNLLAGVASVDDESEIYVFCDSTHVARPDFLRCLVGPVARHHAPFSVGYHEVDTLDNGAITLAYALSVMAMRFLQGVSAFTQPWGGALAMSREAFASFNVAELWRTNVVDDCSLAWWLRKHGAHVALCPAALLLTYAQNHTFDAWRAWLERQILFLKFCLPGQWLGLGLFCAVMIVPPVWGAWSVFRGILGIGGNLAPFLALCWFCLAAWAIGTWRSFLPRKTGWGKWFWAFLLSCCMFALTYTGTIWERNIKWGKLSYRVGKRGKVESINRF